MFKKMSLFMASAMLLAACNTEPQELDFGLEEESTTASVAEETTSTGVTSTEETTSQDTPSSTSHVYDNLIKEDTFTNATGYAAWEHYKQMEQMITLGDAETLAYEQADASTITGDSMQAVRDYYMTLDLAENVNEETLEVNEVEDYHTFQYPPEAGSEYESVAMFFSQTSYIYANDNLFFTSVTPGFYEISLDNLPMTEVAVTANTVSEIEALNGQVFSVAQMKIMGEPINSVMIATESAEGEVNATYFFTQGDTVIYYAYIPFTNVSADFPYGAYSAYYQMIPDMINYLE